MITGIGIEEEQPKINPNEPEYELVVRFRAHTSQEARLVAHSIKRKLRGGEVKALGFVVKSATHNNKAR